MSRFRIRSAVAPILFAVYFQGYGQPEIFCKFDIEFVKPARSRIHSTDHNVVIVYGHCSVRYWATCAPFLEHESVARWRWRQGETVAVFALSA